MTNSGILWAAGLASVVGGAIVGDALGSSPVTDRSVIEMLYQSHETAIADHRDDSAPPNRYPLVTRSGVVPVAQLSERGLFSQARYRSHDIAADYAFRDPGLTFVDTYDVEPEARRVEATAMEPSTVQPLSLADGPAQVAGQAKIIDVQATLAMR